MKVNDFLLCTIFVPVLSFSQSSFSPSDVSGLQVWLTADSVIKDGANNVSQWRDLSGSNNNAIQSIVGFQPLFVGSLPVLNNRPVIRLDGTDDFMEIADTPSLDFTTGMSIFFITRQTVLNPAVEILSKWDFGSQGSWALETASPASELLFYVAYSLAGGGSNNIVSTNANIDTVYYIYSLLYDGSNPNPVSSFKNGTELNMAVNGSIVPSLLNCSATLKIGMFGGLGRYYNGDIAEIIIYDSTLTFVDRKYVEQYLSDKYAPPVNLGVDITVPYGFCPVKINAHQDWFTSYLWSTGMTADSVSTTGNGYSSVSVTNIFGYTSTDTINITFPGKLFPDDTIICYGDTLVWNTQLNKTGYTFLWQDGSGDSLFRIIEAGTYFVRITDTFNCQVTSDTFVVTVDSFPLTASLGPDDTLCAGTIFGLQSGTGLAISYLWSTGETTPQITIDTSGAYSVTVLDSIGCIKQDSINITITGKAPVPGFTIDSICENSATWFTDISYSTDGSNIIQHLWLFGNGDLSTDTNPVYTYDSYGTYFVTLTVATDSGCSNTLTKPVTIHPLPNVSFIPLLGCANTTILFTDQTDAFSDSVISRLWIFDSVNTSFSDSAYYSFDTAGIHSVSLAATTNFGCISSVANQVQIKPSPMVDFAYSSPICSGLPVAFSDQSSMASPWTIITRVWDFGDNFSSGLPALAHAYITTGLFNVILIVAASNGCTDTAEKIIQVGQKPAVGFSVTGNCTNTLTVFTDTSKVSNDTISAWIWTIGDTLLYQKNSSLQITSPGILSVKLSVLTESGCTDSVTKNITVFSPPVPDFSIGPQFPTAGNPVVFINSSTGAAGYIWDFGDGSELNFEDNPEHIYYDTTGFSVILYAYNNLCSDTLVKNIAVSREIINVAVLNVITETINGFLKITPTIGNAGNTTITYLEFVAGFRGRDMDGISAVKELWSGYLNPGEIIQYTLLTSIQLPPEELDYLCIMADTPNLKSDIDTSNNSYCIPAADDMSILRPVNPAAGELQMTISLPEVTYLNVTIVDILGRKRGIVFDGKINKGVYRLHYDLSGFSKGFYAVIIAYEGKLQIEKVLKY
ncbi:MAG: PKD domain-containing protein [Bacteroidetes bacterium]|nr:PKD domain-containing protein [Bacteroidota bacterium]